MIASKLLLMLLGYFIYNSMKWLKKKHNHKYITFSFGVWLNDNWLKSCIALSIGYVAVLSEVDLIHYLDIVVLSQKFYIINSFLWGIVPFLALDHMHYIGRAIVKKFKSYFI